MNAISDGIIISIIWFIAIYTIRDNNLSKIINRDRNGEIEKKIILFAHLFILALIITDIGLLINHDSYIFNIMMDVYKIPLISTLLFITNIYIVYLGTTQMSDEMLIAEGDFVQSKIKVVSFANSLFALSITFALFFIQSVFWGKFSYIYSPIGDANIIYDLIIGAVLIFVPAVIIFVNGFLCAKRERIGRYSLRLSFPMVLFVGIGQLIATKAIVIYRVVGELIKIVKNRFSSEEAEDLELFMFGSTYMKGDRIAKINAYYFISFFSTIFILWGIQASPYPPANSIYLYGGNICTYFLLGVLSFSLVEALGRRFIQYSKYIRRLFIPIMMAFTIIPFYTVAANVGIYGNNSQLISIYHIMSAALGSHKIMLFVFMIVLQGVVAYVLHIVSGEATNNKHYSSIVPLIGILQVVILIIVYPILITSPPYYLQANKLIIVGAIVLTAVVVTYLVGRICNYLFASEKSKWSVYISDYWKDKKRVFVIASCITFATFFVLVIGASFPIKNISVSQVWQNQIISEEASDYTIDFIFTDSVKTGFVSVANDTLGNSMVICSSYEDGSVLWKKNFKSNYDGYKLLENNKIILLMPENSGFTILDYRDGSIDFEYNIDSPSELEFLNIEVNERAVLVTEGITQFVYDLNLGRLEITTLGNNFYKLVPGNKCALIKSDDIYLYQNERWEKQVGNSYIAGANYLYYDENNLIAFFNDEMAQLMPESPYDFVTSIPIAYDAITWVNKEVFTESSDQIVLLTMEQDKAYAYVVNSLDITYHIIALEQQINTEHDIQSITVVDDVGNYILYDDYQFSLYNNETIVARQWYDLLISDSLNESDQEVAYFEPLVKDSVVITIDSMGNCYAISYK